VQDERVVRTDPRLAALARAGDELVQQPRPVLQRPPEALLLPFQPAEDGVALGAQLAVLAAHQLDHALGEAGQEPRPQSEHPALLDGAAHDPAQDVAAILVGRHHAVGDQERHRPRVVGQDAQRAGGLEVVAVTAPRELLPQLHKRPELVGLEHRGDVLEDGGQAVEPQAGVDVSGGQRGQGAGRVLVELHEDQIPVLDEALVVAPRKVVGRPELEAAVDVELRAGPTRAGRPRLPEVLRARTQDDALAGHPDRLPRCDRLLVGPEPQLLVALEHRDPDVPAGDPEALERELPRQLDGSLLEVVAEGEVAQHLEERQVARGVAHVLDVGGAKALLAGGQPVVRERLLPQEVRLERVHPRGGEQDRRVVSGRHQGRRRQAQVIALDEKVQEALADLV
jgi:hypothetical protein